MLVRIVSLAQTFERSIMINIIIWQKDKDLTQAILDTEDKEEERKIWKSE